MRFSSKIREGRSEEQSASLHGRTMKSQELHTPERASGSMKGQYGYANDTSVMMSIRLTEWLDLKAERDALKERVKELEEALAQLHDAYGKDSKAKAAALVKARTLLAKVHLTST